MDTNDRPLSLLEGLGIAPNASGQTDLPTPRMDFLCAEVRAAIDLARQGLRADGLVDGRMLVKMNVRARGIEVIPLPSGAHERLLPFFMGCFEDRGLDVARHAPHGLLVRGTARTNFLIH